MATMTILLNGTWEAIVDFAHSIKDPSALDLSKYAQEWKPIQVPGCWEMIEQNKLADGPVWYRKDFLIPEHWKGETLAIQFDGVNYFCDIWVNSEYVGTHEGGWNGFEVPLRGNINFGNSNRLLVKVYKQGDKFPLRECLAGFLPDVGVIFGGIWKPVTVKTVPIATLKDIYIQPNIHSLTLDVEFRIATQRHMTDSMQLTITIYDQKHNLVAATEQPINTNSSPPSNVHISLPKNVQLWSLDSPIRYHARLQLIVNELIIDETNHIFGIREVTIQGDQILLNGKPIYLRGALHWGWYPEHIAPTPTAQEIRDEISQLKANGFNLVKHCLYVPVKQYFEIADELGILIWQELPMWQPNVTPTFKNRVAIQYDSIIKELRNYCSIVIWTLGCELDHSADSQFLKDLYEQAKHLTGNAIIRDNSGSGECYGGLLKEYADFYDYHFYTDIHFYSDLLSQFAGSWRGNKPWFFGEFCDYDELRNVNAVKLANDGEIPWWLLNDRVCNPVSRDTRWLYNQQEAHIAEHQLLFTDNELASNANRSAHVYRKAVLELVRTYRKVSGYVITSIRDTPISTSAIFNDAGLPKQKPEIWRLFNDNTIIALTWDHRRDWIHGGDRLLLWDHHNFFSGEWIRPHLLLSHYGDENIIDSELKWQLRIIANGSLLDQGIFRGICCFTGEVKEIGVVEIAAPDVSQPTKVEISVELSDGKKSVTNQWEFIIFPNISLSNEEQASIMLEDPCGMFTGLEKWFSCFRKEIYRTNKEYRPKVILTSYLNIEHMDFLSRGGKVFYVQRGEGHFTIKQMPFWRESLQLFQNHPITRSFPHENHTGLALFGLATDTVFDKQALPNHIPVMERLDARKFELDSYMIEVSVGSGKLVASTLRFEGGLGSQPDSVARNTAGAYWLTQILKYLLEA